MKRAIIYQIGRLDVNTFNEIDFDIEEKIFRTSLSSFAIKDFLQANEYETEVTLIYPASLPLNSALLTNKGFSSSCPDDCYRLLEEALNKPEMYLRDPKKFFKTHPHSKKSSESMIIHSLGEYKTSCNTVRFNCSYSDIVLLILINMINKYLAYEDVIEKIVVDISSGHNIYVSALIESLRYLSTCTDILMTLLILLITTLIFRELQKYK